MTLVLSSEERRELIAACGESLCIRCALAPFCPGKASNIDFVIEEEITSESA